MYNTDFFGLKYFKFSITTVYDIVNKYCNVCI